MKDFIDHTVDHGVIELRGVQSKIVALNYWVWMNEPDEEEVLNSLENLFQKIESRIKTLQTEDVDPSQPVSFMGR